MLYFTPQSTTRHVFGAVEAPLVALGDCDALDEVDRVVGGARREIPQGVLRVAGGDGAHHDALRADPACDGARVDAGEARDAVLGEVVVQRAERVVVARRE